VRVKLFEIIFTCMDVNIYKYQVLASLDSCWKLEQLDQ